MRGDARPDAHSICQGVDTLTNATRIDASRSAITSRHFETPRLRQSTPEREGHLYRTPPLSAREVEVMIAWFASDSKTEAARSVHISVGTINTHLTRIRHKYSAVGRPAPTKAALFARALQDGLTKLDDW